jgi:tetratricopeptide (TPR) repeat protein
MDTSEWIRHAENCTAQGRFDDAISSYRRAIELAPERASLLERLALSLLSAQRLDAARTVRDQMMSRFPSHAGTHVIDGHIHRIDRRNEDAIKAYKQAIELDELRYDAIYNLVALKPPALAEPLALRIEAMRRNSTLDAVDLANLDFASARMYENAGNFEIAFDRYASANAHSSVAMAARGIVYKPEEMERRIDTLIARYPAESFAEPIEPLSIVLKPIFILGLPRSGATLVEEILASLPRIVAGGKLPIAPMCEQLFTSRNTSEDAAAVLHELRERYVDALFERDLCGRYVTDKLPGNFLIAGFLRLLFPNAIIIHVKRNLMATCWSLFTSNFGIYEPYSTSLEHLAHYARQYQRIMTHWRAVITQPAMVEIQYEDLVTHPEQEMRRLLAACDLPWDARCLTANHRQVTQPIYAAAMDRWRHYTAHLHGLEP